MRIAPSRRPGGCLAAALGLAALSLICCAVLLAAQQGLGRAALSGGLWVEACAGLATEPRWQVGLAWVSPISSYLPSLAYSRYAVCVDIPLAKMPGRLYGELLLPP